MATAQHAAEQSMNSCYALPASEATAKLHVRLYRCLRKREPATRLASAETDPDTVACGVQPQSAT